MTTLSINQAAFRTFLQKNPAKTFRSFSTTMCPLGAFLKRGLIYAGGEVVTISDGKRLPAWAQRFCAALENSQYTGSQALALLDRVAPAVAA